MEPAIERWAKGFFTLSLKQYATNPPDSLRLVDLGLDGAGEIVIRSQFSELAHRCFLAQRNEVIDSLREYCRIE